MADRSGRLGLLSRARRSLGIGRRLLVRIDEPRHYVDCRPRLVIPEPLPFGIEHPAGHCDRDRDRRALGDLFPMRAGDRSPNLPEAVRLLLVKNEGAVWATFKH